MKKTFFGIVCLGLALASCASLNNKNETRKAFCKEINRRMIFFNGTTSNTSIAQTQRAEMDNLSQDYRREGCS